MNTDSLIKDTIFAVIDVETTGLYPHNGDRICEIGIMRIKNGKIEDSYQTLINPQRPIPAIISSLTGITDDMVKDSPVFSDIINDICSLVKDAVLVCHNAKFDLSFLSLQMKGIGKIDNPVIDTLFLARKYFDFPSNKLGYIAKHLELTHENKHRAMGDVEITREIFEYFLGELNKIKKIVTLNNLLEFQKGIK
jgi:DNA polymerase III epsilon subunit family exonuclease